ncbi:hypothetical protein SmJEL517_g01087 [Synchytrium microbalum]|uniref:Phosphatidyl-N-methylethanolamine N-methyltransferase n=1 Tax=Synchytrium microbalum TaxID=1806994 RepID=A0A507CC52_9FUNG|nr:uncharacterized protein SmJEL517_g01087 [Synchytrium microbalum]TPX36918.1 hypothetical protein SmJEL517_g01087 [Synchytrium microbalum]
MDAFTRVMNLALDGPSRLFSILPTFPGYSPAVVAAGYIFFHVFNYNATAQLEYRTKIFTKALGKNAVYVYAVYLVTSGMIRHHYVMRAIHADAGTLEVLPEPYRTIVGLSLIIFGSVINLWAIQTLGIKGIYNGDSFGFLFDAPVTNGIYRYISDPQYLGTGALFLGNAIQQSSKAGYGLASLTYIVYTLSVRYIEGPHMQRMYAAKHTRSAKSARPGLKKKAK